MGCDCFCGRCGEGNARGGGYGVGCGGYGVGRDGCDGNGCFVGGCGVSGCDVSGCSDGCCVGDFDSYGGSGYVFFCQCISNKYFNFIFSILLICLCSINYNKMN